MIMIQAKECRLGNLLHDKKNNRIVAFYGLTEGLNKVIVNYANGSGIYYLEFDEVEPIKITEDILLKCGFVYEEGFYIKDGLAFEELEDGRLLIDGLGFSLYKDDFEKHITSYIHELQNLYFALTKQELQVNL